MTNTRQIGWLVAWMIAGVLMGALLALWQEVPARQIPFWAVMGVLVVLVGKLVHMMGMSEQHKVQQPEAVQTQTAGSNSVPEEASRLGVAIPDRRLSEEEARVWLDDLLVKQQAGTEK